MFKNFWDKINGKKTVTGLIVTVVGIVMFNVPFIAPAAPYVISTGLAALGIGGTHKLIKIKE